MANERTWGFTMIDVMIAIALVAILGAAIMPVVNGYIVRGTLDSTTRDIVAAARYAQVQSQAGVDGDTWGVSVASGVITVFRGTTFAARDTSYDQTVTYPSSTVSSGTTEYVFSERTGRTTSGSLALTSSSGTVQTITVNSMGMIDF